MSKRIYWSIFFARMDNIIPQMEYSFLMKLSLLLDMNVTNVAEVSRSFPRCIIIREFIGMNIIACHKTLIIILIILFFFFSHVPHHFTVATNLLDVMCVENFFDKKVCPIVTDFVHKFNVIC